MLQPVLKMKSGLRRCSSAFFKINRLTTYVPSPGLQDLTLRLHRLPSGTLPSSLRSSKLAQARISGPVRSAGKLLVFVVNDREGHRRLTFPLFSLQRGPDGKFSDDDIAKILQDAYVSCFLNINPNDVVTLDVQYDQRCWCIWCS
jgi:hypothetical protein